MDLGFTELVWCKALQEEIMQGRLRVVGTTTGEFLTVCEINGFEFEGEEAEAILFILATDIPH